MQYKSYILFVFALTLFCITILTTTTHAFGVYRPSRSGYNDYPTLVPFPSEEELHEIGILSIPNIASDNNNNDELHQPSSSSMPLQTLQVADPGIPGLIGGGVSGSGKRLSSLHTLSSSTTSSQITPSIQSTDSSISTSIYAVQKATVKPAFKFITVTAPIITTHINTTTTTNNLLSINHQNDVQPLSSSSSLSSSKEEEEEKHKEEKEEEKQQNQYNLSSIITSKQSNQQYIHTARRVPATIQRLLNINGNNDTVEHRNISSTIPSKHGL